MTFYNTRFPTDISVGSSGGPSWKTDVIVFDSGGEQRNQRWSDLRNSYDAAYGVRTIEQLRSVVAFFNEMRGRQHAFRYKDFLDYEATEESLVIDGSPFSQLTKTYGTGLNDYVKDIKKPRLGATFRRGGVSLPVDSYDASVGVVFYSADSTKQITGISQANPGVCSIASHGFTTGDKIYLKDLVGMDEINFNVVTITVIDVSSFSIGIDTTTFDPYLAASGDAIKYPQPGDVVDWSGEFDIPCRFDTDQLSVVLDNYELGGTQIPIIEVKI